MLKHFCDNCQQELPFAGKKYRVEAGNWARDNPPIHFRTWGELCQECFDGIVKALESRHQADQKVGN